MRVQCGDRLSTVAIATMTMQGQEAELCGNVFNVALLNQSTWTQTFGGRSMHQWNAPQVGVLERVAVNEVTLGDVVCLYFVENPRLSEKTKESYRECILHGFRERVNQPIACLTRNEILQLNLARLQQLTAADPVNKPPRGFWAGNNN